MSTNLISEGFGAKESGEITLPANTFLTIAGWSPEPDEWKAEVMRKMSNGEWQQIASVSYELKQVTIFGAGTYKVVKPEHYNCIIDKD